MSNYEKTARAFLAEENVLWDVIDALTEEMPGDCSAGALAECVEYLREQGVEKSVTTIKHYRITGSYVDEATSEQRRVLRSQSATTVTNFAVYSVPQADAARLIEQYQRETGRCRMGALAVRDIVSPKGPRQVSQTNLNDPETWTPAQWEAFDKKVSTACEVVLDAFLFRRNGWYVPSVEATASLALLRQDDLDAELAALTREA